MSIYGGIDLHSSNNFLALVDSEGRELFKRKLLNQREEILCVLEPYRSEIEGIAVESTYNWYWLVDSLMDAGYSLHLANPSGMQKYSGLKHSNDKSDALWLAELLRLGILPEGYIYPRESRSLRDLLRKRSHLVKLRTSLKLSFQSMVSRNLGHKLRCRELTRRADEYLKVYWHDDDELALIAETNMESILCLDDQINRIEKRSKGRIKPRSSYRYLLTIPGIGDIIGMTIELETGPIDRFATVGSYVSYCRKVGTEWSSNDKVKGKGNRKNGNRYLSWAFSEAAELARRHNEACRRFYNRKLNRGHKMVAHAALAHKLARAAYYIMRDEVPFDEKKLFS